MVVNKREDAALHDPNLKFTADAIDLAGDVMLTSRYSIARTHSLQKLDDQEHLSFL